MDVAAGRIDDETYLARMKALRASAHQVDGGSNRDDARSERSRSDDGSEQIRTAETMAQTAKWKPRPTARTLWA